MSENNSPRRPTYERAALRRILTDTKTIAAVGVSANPNRPSYMVMRYLQQRGYRVIPVNPAYAGQTLHREPVYASLSEIPAGDDPVQMVDIFRKSEAAGAVVDEALTFLGERGLATVWMQIDVIDWAAAARAEAAGVSVVMDRCPKMEHGRIFGELGAFGVNTGMISSKI
ncbi:MAG: CoA-binding protein [Neomegalonema sp.]|nr:CoA-binding protein [Neomegalonema sp.]